jgi:hypothetical protein
VVGLQNIAIGQIIGILGCVANNSTPRYLMTYEYPTQS